MNGPNTVDNFAPKLTGALLAGLLFVTVALACRSSSSSSEEKCTAEISYQEKIFTGGPAKTADEAQKLACNKYCLEADPEFDAHYGIWLDSPQGQAAGRPPKQEAIYKDKELMNYLVHDCAMKCLASVRDGKLKGTATCP
ncbi:MAG TPA: hypothetical protein VGJ55_02820 [Pyrinomonadaceae bacterium]|jgi:hypothetical protein